MYLYVHFIIFLNSAVAECLAWKNFLINRTGKQFKLTCTVSLNCKYISQALLSCKKEIQVHVFKLSQIHKLKSISLPI